MIRWSVLGEAEEENVEEAGISETSGTYDVMCQTDLTSDCIKSLQFEWASIWQQPSHKI